MRSTSSAERVSTATIVLLPESTSAEPMLLLFRALSQQYLIERVWLMLGDQHSLTMLEPGGNETEVERSDVLQQSFDRFCLVNLVTADSTEVHSQFERASAVGKAFETALAVGLDGGVVQHLNMLNLVAPCAVDGSMPVDAFKFGDDTAIGWTNILLAAEVQSDSTSAVAMIEPDERYVANVVCGVVSLTGLWVTASAPEFAHNAAANLWHVARTRMRMLAAPELAQRVVNRAARRDPPLPQDMDRTYRALEGAALDDAVDAVVQSLADHHHLKAVAPPVAVSAGEQSMPGMRGLLKIIGVWLRRRLPQLVADEIRGVGHRVVAWTEDRVNGAFATEDLEFRFSFLERTSTPQSSSDVSRSRERQRLLVPIISPEPELWENLRSAVFGLMDGSAIPYGLESAIATPATRYVVCARSRLVPPPAEPLVQDPADQGRSVVGVVVGLLDRAVEDAQGFTNEFERQLAELRDEAMPVRRSLVRRVLGALGRIALFAIKVAVFVAVTVALVVLPYLIPIAALLFVVWVVLGIAVWVFGMFRLLGGFVWRRFRRDYQRSETATREQMLQLGLLACRAQESRFRQLRTIGQEWGQILSYVVHQPFGPPRLSERPRVHRQDLHLPASHQVVEPSVSELRMNGVVNRVRQKLFPAGWMAMRYASLLGAVEAAFALQMPGARFAPDFEGADDGHGGHSARRVLLESLISGRATATNEIDARNIVEAALLDPQGMPGDGELEDRLFTEASTGLPPSEFLAQARKGLPAQWNRDLIGRSAEIGEGSPELGIARVVEELKPHRLQPAALSLEQIIEGRRPDYPPFALASFCVELAVNVPAGLVRAFSAQPTPVDLDLGRAGRIWLPPPPVDEGEVLILDEGDRAGLGIPDETLPAVGELIRPQRRVDEPSHAGAYSFLLEVDGDPVQWPADRPIRYQVRQAAAPVNGMTIVKQCLQRTADATGLSFEFGGTFAGLATHELGEGIFISWAYDAEFREFARATVDSERAIGFGGPRSVARGGGQPILVSGIVVLNTEMAYEPIFGSGCTHGAVLLHELGHVMNLGHVSIDNEVMYPYSSDDSVIEWGPGDRVGLYLSVLRPSLALP